MQRVLLMRGFEVIPLMLLHQCSLSLETAERGADHVLSASVSPPEEIPISLGWVVKLDPTIGKINTSTFRLSGKGIRSNSARSLASVSTVRHLQTELDMYGVAQRILIQAKRFRDYVWTAASPFGTVLGQNTH